MRRGSRILLLCGIVSLSLPAYSQLIKGDTALFALDEITITAVRIPQTSRQFVRLNRIMTKEEIADYPVQDLAGLLEYLPDLDVRQRGPAGVQADVSLRGGTFDQGAVLINGINFSDPQTGHFHLDIPVPLNLIHTVEVLSGSDVKSLGANAFSGAINIVTRPPEQNFAHAGVSGGMFGYRNAQIDGGLRMRNWWQQIGADYRKSDGYRENTDFNNLNLFYQAGFSRDRLSMSLFAGGLRKAFGANSFYSARYPNQFEKTATGFGSVQLDRTGRVNVRQSLYYRSHADEFSLFRSNPPVWYTSPNFHMSHTAGSKTDVWFASLWGRTAFGLELRRESILSTVLGLQLDDPKPVRWEENAVFTHKGTRSHYSLSAEQHVVAGRFRINGGMILHAVQATRNFLQVYPGLDVSFTPVMPFKTFLSVNRAFRLPTFTELYYQSPTNSGNPELQPETAWHAETGAEYRRGPLNARITGFYRYAPESIDWVRLPDEFQWHTENLGRIKTWGFETGIGYKPQDQNGLGKVIDQADLGLRRYYQAHSAGSYYSQYLLDYLRWKITAGMVLRAGERLRFSAQLVWQDRNGTFTYMDSQQNTFEVEYEPFMVVDVKLSYRFRWFSWSAGCNNLLDASYFDLGALPQPGVWFHTGLEVHLTGKQ